MFIQNSLVAVQMLQSSLIMKPIQLYKAALKNIVSLFSSILFSIGSVQFNSNKSNYEMSSNQLLSS